MAGRRSVFRPLATGVSDINGLTLDFADELASVGNSTFLIYNLMAIAPQPLLGTLNKAWYIVAGGVIVDETAPPIAGIIFNGVGAFSFTRPHICYPGERPVFLVSGAGVGPVGTQYVARCSGFLVQAGTEEDYFFG